MAHAAYNIHSNKNADNVTARTQCSLEQTGCRAIRRGLLALLAVVTCVWMLGCVKTTECNKHVNCGSDKIYYQHQYMMHCEKRDQCAEDEVCASCQVDRQNP